MPAPWLEKLALFGDLGYEPHQGQLLVHNSEARFRITACGVRWGKTLCAAMEGIAAAMEPAERSMGWVVAPTYDLADRVFREIEVIVLEHMKHRLVAKKDAERRIILRNLGGGISEIRAKSADNPVSLLGEGLDWLIVDEASRLKPLIWQNHLSQRLIDKRGWALFISTPKGKGWFYELFRRGRGAERDPDYESWNMPSWTNPLLDASLIEAERSRLPARTFAQEYGAEFVEGSGSVFRNVRECATGQYRPFSENRAFYAGLDLAKVEDFTVIAVMNEHREVICSDRFHKLDWALQMQRIHTVARKYPDLQILCDATGMGDPIFETLKREGLCVKPYAFTAASKSALIENLALMLEQRQIVLPRPDQWPELVDELEAFQYSITDSGHVRSGAPSGQHDDCVVAVALAAWQVRPCKVEPTLVVQELR